MDIKKQRIDFVRFQGVQNSRELEKQLDAIWIGNWKLNVKKPKYNRAVETRKEWKDKQKGEVNNGRESG